MKVSDLAQTAEGESPFISTGKRIAEDPIKQDKGTFKGQLHYEAEFVPALLVNNVKFHGGLNELQRATKKRNSGGSDDGGTVDASDASSISTTELEETTHATPTASSPMPDKSRGHKSRKSNATTHTTESNAVSESNADGEKEDDKASVKTEPGLKITKDDLSKYRKWQFSCVLDYPV